VATYDARFIDLYEPKSIEIMMEEYWDILILSVLVSIAYIAFAVRLWMSSRGKEEKH
jgi:hypothetical protein